MIACSHTAVQKPLSLIITRALIRVHTNATEYVLVRSVKLVHNIEIRLITVSIIVLTPSEQ